MTRDELAAIGLGDLEPGAAERILSPSPTAGQALGRPEVVIATLSALLQTSATDLHFLPVASGLLKDAGATVAFLHENPQIIRFSTTTGDQPLVVRAATGGVLQPSDDPGTLYWQAVPGAHVVFELPSGFFAVGSTQGELSVQSLTSVLAGRGINGGKAPIDEWANRSGDEWLVQLLRRHQAAGGTWHDAVGAGLLARLFESDTAQEAYVSSVQVLRGTGAELPEAPRRWARQLTSEQCRTITDLGLVEIDQLHRALDELEPQLTAGEGPWCTAWIDVCYRRDDLSCVALVLHEAGSRDGHLSNALVRLDRAGRHVLFSVPRGAIVDDERLRRVRLTDPLAWWGSPENVDDLL